MNNGTGNRCGCLTENGCAGYSAPSVSPRETPPWSTFGSHWSGIAENSNSGNRVSLSIDAEKFPMWHPPSTVRVMLSPSVASAGENAARGGRDISEFPPRGSGVQRLIAATWLTRQEETPICIGATQRWPPEEE